LVDSHTLSPTPKSGSRRVLLAERAFLSSAAAMIFLAVS
jgi:hypothetical protein